MTDLLSSGALIENSIEILTSVTPVVLTAESATYLRFTGTTAQFLDLPVASTCFVGQKYVVANRSTAIVTVRYQDLTFFADVSADSTVEFRLYDNGSANGDWDLSSGGGGSVSLSDGGIETEVDTTEITYTVLSNKVNFHPFMHVVTGHTITVASGARLVSTNDTIDGTVVVDPGGIWKVL